VNERVGIQEEDVQHFAPRSKPKLLALPNPRLMSLAARSTSGKSFLTISVLPSPGGVVDDADLDREIGLSGKEGRYACSEKLTDLPTDDHDGHVDPAVPERTFSLADLGDGKKLRQGKDGEKCG